MKGILKSPALCSRHPQRHKSVSFPAGSALCTNVHEADEWDRTPVAATRKLSYQDILELKEMQIALLKNTPAFPQLLSTVPVGLVPLLPPEQPWDIDKSVSASFEKVDEVGASWMFGTDQSAQDQSGGPVPTDSVPPPPISVPVQSQSVTPTRKFFLPIVPLQESSSSPPRALRISPPPPLPSSPTRSTSPASSISSSPPFTSPLSGRSSPFGRSCSPASPSIASHSPISAFKSQLPRLPSPGNQQSPENIVLSSPQRIATDHLSHFSQVGTGFSVPKFLTPIPIGIYGTHNTFRDYLPPNPLFAPYSIAATRSNIHTHRMRSPISRP